MKKLILAVLVLAILATATYVVVRTADFRRPSPEPQQPVPDGVTELPEAPPGAIVFDLKYRGLTAPDDPLSYRSYWGYGGPPETDAPFVLAVKKQVREFDLVYHAALPLTPWSVVELEDGKPVAFYFDIDADGKLSESERFSPASPSGSNFGYPYAFITSDFMIRTEDQREIPFRVMLVGASYRPGEISYMWSPACVLEGHASVAGEPTKLYLYGPGFSGTFTEFGRCSLALVPDAKEPQEHIPRDNLSSLICYKGTFYRLKLYGRHEKDKTVRLVLEKDTTPTGRLAVELTGKEPLKTDVTHATIKGTADASIHFSMGDVQAALPAGRYQLASAYLNYGIRNDDEWQVNFSAGPGFEISDGQTSRVELGDPVLSVRAIDEKDRYNSEARERSSFAQGTSIYPTPQINGKSGEIYTRLSRISRKDAQPERCEATHHHPRLRRQRSGLGRYGVRLRRTLRVLVARTE